MGCGEQQELTYAESCRESVSYTSHLNDYLEENAWQLDAETLQSEAGDAEKTLSQQFQATALLCALEYRKLMESIPGGSSHQYGFKKELDSRVEDNPVKILAVGDELIASGYFDGWISSKWRTTFFCNDVRAEFERDIPIYLSANSL